MELPKGLPEQVAKRIDLRAVCVRSRGVPVEARRAAPRQLDIRQISDIRAEIAGYATVYDWTYDVYGGPDNGGFTETILGGAAKRSVKNLASTVALEDRDDVRFLVNHDGVPLARTRSGTLGLESDRTGLLSIAGVDLRSTSVRDLVIAMERGDIDEMSFAFQVLDQEWNSDYTERLVREVRLYDTSVVTYPANPAASAYLRGEQIEDEQRESVPTMSLALARAEADALLLHR